MLTVGNWSFRVFSSAGWLRKSKDQALSPCRGPSVLIPDFSSRLLSAVLTVVLLGVAVVGGATVTAAHAVGSREIGPPDVYRLTQTLRDELELVRREMGKSLVPHPAGRVSRVAPREVYFQALTLFTKVNRLSFELMRETAPEFEPPTGEIRPAQVYAVVEKALEQLRRIKQKLGISEVAPEGPRNKDMTPADAFQSIVKANRQLNTMLTRRFDPSDVYQEVTRALSYTTSLRELLPQPRIPDEVPFERRKVPADVYRKLLENLEVVREILEKSGYYMMDFEPLETESITPSDVFDVASLLVAELVFLHSQAVGAASPRKAYHPGDKFPSHVYQRAGLLHAALSDLLVQVQRNPAWLKAGEGLR